VFTNDRELLVRPGCRQSVRKQHPEADDEGALPA
jgi:hypothetical protein